MFEYTPGKEAFSTALGRGFNHRSGFHSSASSPHKTLWRLQARTATSTLVPFGIGMLSITVPSELHIGSDSGRLASSKALVSMHREFASRGRGEDV